MKLFRLSDELYDFLNRCTKYGLPAIGAFYLAISQIWNLPYGEQVLSTVVALEALLGALLLISKYEYNKEPLPVDGVVHYNPDMETMSLELNKLPSEVAEQGVGLFEVKQGRYGDYSDPQ